jgi:hypothetical protein
VDIAFQTPAELGGRGDRAKPLLWLPNNAGWVVNSGLIVTAGNGPATAIARLGLDRVQSVEFSNDGLLRGIQAGAMTKLVVVKPSPAVLAMARGPASASATASTATAGPAVH